MGLILDSTELVTAERAGLTARRALLSYGDTQEIGVSVISLAELQHGVERAHAVSVRLRRETFLAEIMGTVPIYNVVPSVTIRAGKLDAALQSAGQMIAFNDLLIAATALELGWTLVTRNRKHFERIPNLSIDAR